MGINDQKKNLKPFHIILIAILVIGGGILYANRERLIPDINAQYKEQYSVYTEAEAEIVEIGSTKGRRGSRMNATVRFYDSAGEAYTRKLEDNHFEKHKKGDTVKVYFDPEDPQRTVITEWTYNEVMGR